MTDDEKIAALTAKLQAAADQLDQVLLDSCIHPQLCGCFNVLQTDQLSDDCVGKFKHQSHSSPSTYSEVAIVVVIVRTSKVKSVLLVPAFPKDASHIDYP